MDEQKQSELEALLRDHLAEVRQGKLSIDQLHSLIETFGEEHFVEAIPDIEHLLTHEDPWIREASLKTLTLYFQLQKHWETARRFLLEDPDEDCRDMGARALYFLKKNTGDRASLELLAPIVCNETVRRTSRKSAYSCMRGIIHFIPQEPLAIQNERFVLERHADWTMVYSFLNEEGQLYLERRAQTMAEEVQESQKALQNDLMIIQQGGIPPVGLLPSIRIFGQKRFFPAIPELEHLLSNEDSQIRIAALKTLTLYFGLEKYWETARRFLLDDPDEDCRVAGAEALSYLQQDTNDRRTLALLASVISNKDEPQPLRKMAYAALLAVRHYDPRDGYTVLSESYMLESEADWHLVDEYLR